MADLRGSNRAQRIAALGELAKKGTESRAAIARVEQVAAEKNDIELSSWAAACAAMIDPSPKDYAKIGERMLDERVLTGLLWMASSGDEELVSEALPAIAYRVLTSVSG